MHLTQYFADLSVCTSREDSVKTVRALSTEQ